MSPLILPHIGQYDAVDINDESIATIKVIVKVEVVVEAKKSN